MSDFIAKKGVSRAGQPRVRYESNLLPDTRLTMEADPTYTYVPVHVNKTVKVTNDRRRGQDRSRARLTLEASPTDADMAVPGYKFLGWISTAEVSRRTSAVWNYIYDVADDSYVTSDPEKAAPYLVTRRIQGHPVARMPIRCTQSTTSTTPPTCTAPALTALRVRSTCPSTTSFPLDLARTLTPLRQR